MKKQRFDLRALIRPDLLKLPGYVPIEPSDVLAAVLHLATAGSSDRAWSA